MVNIAMPCGFMCNAVKEIEIKCGKEKETKRPVGPEEPITDERQNSRASCAVDLQNHSTDNVNKVQTRTNNMTLVIMFRV